ncbi:transcriptional regulator [Bacillus mycoides]|uniref:helix-turn-helix domain-containing protein n=1 Tax=Bacillus cereus group TaxID=86661 RepID=UPI0008F27A2C|nr:helix-turn-helix domain-containing protein [Bacillus mycoides]MED4685709.1 helix-turn-helix domain-containing protein [Bacillus mycoides]SFQ77519.1 transcriptional regulator [Bacillus mycoides]
MDFPTRLKQIRLEHKLTQEQLGEKINVTKVSVSGYENRNRTPDTETLQKLADYFDISVDYLLGRTNKRSLNNTPDEFNQPLNDPELGLWFKDIKDASPEKQEELRLFWEFIKMKEKNRKPGDKQK